METREGNVKSVIEVLDGSVAVGKLFESDDLHTAAFCSQSYRKEVAVIKILLSKMTLVVPII